MRIHYFTFGTMAQNCWCFVVVGFCNLKHCKTYKQYMKTHMCSSNNKTNEQLLNHHLYQEMEHHQYPSIFPCAPMRLHILPHPQIITVLNFVLTASLLFIRCVYIPVK